MKIAIIDADLIGRDKHRFPNLVCMKLSGYYKEFGHDVKLITDYKDLYYDESIWIDYQSALEEHEKRFKKHDELNSKILCEKMSPCFREENIKFDKVFISKVFTDTPIDEDLLTLSNVEYGGTGFFYDKAPKLLDEVEHHMPDYHLYDEWVNERLKEGGKRKDFTYYLDYSIGFMSRGCIRQCSFCVNKNYKSCNVHSHLSEFLDESRSYICLLDDNVLACKDWRNIFEELIATGKKFQFKQGCDERLLTDEKCEILFNKSKWIGDRIFAFDNIKDREVIERKLKMIRKHTNNQIKFYTFCGYNHDDIGVYDEKFWVKDIEDLFERIKILMTYGCLPYVMRFKDYVLSPYKGIYINAASWCNQPSLFRKMSFAEYSMARGMSNENYKKYKMDFDSYLADGNKKGSSWRYYEEFSRKYPEIAEKYFYMKWNYSNRNS